MVRKAHINYTLPYGERETLTWRTRRAAATKLAVEEHILIRERQ